MKTYVLILSKTFPADHPRNGLETNFKVELGKALCKKDCYYCENVWKCNLIPYRKLHTIRQNYDLWEKRISEIQAGRAVLSIRQWIGTPYRSKTIEIARLTAEDGVGIEKLTFNVIRKEGNVINFLRFDVNGRDVDADLLSMNDGLSLKNWYYWFKLNEDIPYREPMAIIHFTKYRYNR